MSTLLAVTSYTHPDILAHTPKGTPNTEGLTAYWLDHATGTLTKAGSTELGPNPAFVLQHPHQPDVVYCSTERIDEDGSVLALRLGRDGDAVSLELADEAPAGGKSTCYLAADATGRWLRVANYWDARLAVLAVDGPKLGEAPAAHALPPQSVLRDKAFARRCEKPAEYCATRPTREEHWRYRQRWPHAHCVVTEPSGAWHFVVDLGEDAVYHYAFDAAVGRLACKGATRLARGGGPRHVVFHPTKPAAFLVNELASTVSCFALDLDRVHGVRGEDDADAALRVVQKLSTLPADFANDHRSVDGIWKAESHAAEIRLDAAGDWLFVANRGHDSLAVFAVAFDGGAPSLRLAHVHKTTGACGARRPATRAEVFAAAPRRACADDASTRVEIDALRQRRLDARRAEIDASRRRRLRRADVDASTRAERPFSPRLGRR